MRIGRRSALGLIGAGAFAPAAGARTARKVAFAHGVASGDPTVRGAVLWTRVTADGAEAVDVRWTVADGDKPVESGHAQARGARDFTVKVEPGKLRPGVEYRYWFESGGVRSPVGRFRTLPVGVTKDAVFAVVSCQLHAGGLFNAYDAIAKLDRLDAVLHLGDYIYEYGPEGYGGSIGAKIGRVPEPPREIVTLADYRTRHAQYKRDHDLQAAHARAAFIAVWDDHETANDAWIGGAENHQGETEGDWKARKAAAMQAYFEWMPIRDPLPGNPWEAINRSFAFGDLAHLFMVETRLLARSEQAAFKHQAPDAAAFATVLAERDRDDRELLGPKQRQWLEDGLKASVAGGTPWQILGNQVVMARVAGPDLEKIFGAEQYAQALEGLEPEYATQVAAGQESYRAGIPFNLDAWDGYPAARERLYAGFRRAGSRPIVLSGDSHAFWANDLRDASGEQVAVEFGTTGISSPSIGDAVPNIPVGQLIDRANPEVAFCDQRAKGFIVLTLTAETAHADYRAVSTIFAKPYDVTSVARFEASAANRADSLTPAA